MGLTTHEYHTVHETTGDAVRYFPLKKMNLFEEVYTL